MTTSAHLDALNTLSDRELIAEIRRLAERERHATADVIAALMELDERKLYLGEGCRSLFTYCTQVLHFSDYVELNIIGLMLRSVLCEADPRGGSLLKRESLRFST